MHCTIEKGRIMRCKPSKMRSSTARLACRDCDGVMSQHAAGGTARQQCWSLQT